MKQNLQDLIKNSVKHNQENRNINQADMLIKNADKALGLDEHKSKITKKRTSTTIHQTFSLTSFDVDTIGDIVDIFLARGIVISKSEVIKIALNVLKNTSSEVMIETLSKIERKSKNGW